MVAALRGGRGLLLLVWALLPYCTLYAADAPGRVAKYSGVSEESGDVFYPDLHYTRRRKRDAEARWRSPGTHGLARQCGAACSMRFRSRDTIHVVHLHIFDPQHVGHVRHPYKPLVQHMVSDNETTINLAQASPNCIYRAHVHGAKESSIVNLCERHGSVCGLLALPDGIYSVEPLEEEGAGQQREHHRMQPHLVHKLRGHNYVQYDEDPVDPNSYNFTYHDGEWLQTQDRKRRSRRSSMSWEHYVEVFVAADTQMAEYHGSQLEDYILTLFSTVASIYRHRSLGAAINIVVVRIAVLHHEYNGPRVTENAQKSLQNFCQWQMGFNEMNEESPNHHDVAVLLTRKDICRAAGKCDTLGLAELGTMCNFNKSCSIIEDNGLSAAFTIAHELAHLFNMPHDDEPKCRQWMEVTKENFHIMAPTLEFNTHPWSWSACSAAMLERFLEQRDRTQCLFDQPTQRRFYDDLFEVQPAGIKYSADRQCEFVFGRDSKLCPYMPSCRRLWCQLPQATQVGCRTQHMPWADGTPCNSHASMFCHRGQCVGMQPGSRMRRDGGWGEWGPWGDCSRTCGGGVQKTVRHCNSPEPANGGKYCVGKREDYRSCNIGDCPWDTPPFRDVQCAAYNHRDVGIHGVPQNTTWIPKYQVAPNERCKLYCRIETVSAYYLLKPKVVDGTPCDQNGDDLCVDGACRKAGCDHVLGSNVEKDRCGICGGDGSSCRHVKGSYNERGSFGYNEVLKIPAGSANIEITQTAWRGNKEDDNNYLSLRTSNGDFLLNGKYQVVVYNVLLQLQDVILEYSGSDNLIERINGTGPTRSDIFVNVLTVGNLTPPDIRYEYMASTAPASVAQPPSYLDLRTGHVFWRLADDWTVCTRSCKGEQVHAYVCIDGRSNRPTSERNCMAIRAPPTARRRSCNDHCTNRWQSDPESGCSASCGSGEQMMKVTCVRVEDADSRRWVQVHDRECDPSTRPQERVHCHQDCSGRGGHWTYTSWSDCSASCGDSGVTRRSAYCADSHGRQLDQRYCDVRSRETIEKPCNRAGCPRWNYGQWNECSKSCDGGIRRRQPTCVDVDDRELSPNHCAQVPRLDYEACNEQECVWWEFSDWGQCSGECGRGTAYRTATCRTKRGVVDDGRCDVREKLLSKECDTGRACAIWKTTEWSMCPSGCGEQWSTRRVDCTDSNGVALNERVCLRRIGPKPDTHRECPPGPCSFWKTEPFGACSVSCGRGKRTRAVSCIQNNEMVDDSFCSAAPKPAVTENCVLAECAEWQPSPWSTCSASCGAGNQTRSLTCVQKGDTVHLTLCDQKTRPKSVKDCSKGPCAAESQLSSPKIWWATGSWTECSTKCGKGKQRRLVKCRDKFRDLPESYCSHLERVEDERECDEKPCARWSQGPWKPCPSTCGEHIYQERAVRCVGVADDAEDVAEELCDRAVKPNSTRDCRLPKCPATQTEPPTGRWIAQKWTECSATCGGGWRTRVVSCSARQCDVARRPLDAERCGADACPAPAANYTWQLPPWSACSVTCGAGEVRREVWCEDKSRTKVPDSRCPIPKPPERRRCQQPACPLSRVRAEKPRWKSGPWSPCSRTCGKGQRTRIVECVSDVSEMVLADEKCPEALRPTATIRCRVQPCARWRAKPWGQCSETCGVGVQTRKIYCKLGKKTQDDDSKCQHLPAKPSNSTRCVRPACPTYSWISTPWSKCIDPCGDRQQMRNVLCMKGGSVKAAPHMCNGTKPIERRKCPASLCPYEWVPGPWNTCTQSCGNGTQTRDVDCRLKTSHSYLNNRKKLEPVVPKERCGLLPQPSATQPCSVNVCGTEYSWVIDPWGPCSTTCGPGVRRRKVRCQGRMGERGTKEQCEAFARKPNRTQSCFNRNCLPATCQEIKASMKTTHAIDSEYAILLDGYQIRVHCHMMNETVPRAYISVDPATNFAEVYGRRLVFPHTCPHGGQRNDSCECSAEGAAGAGLTRFRKLRLDLMNRRININDFTFADTIHGQPVPYATAGDCYSMRDCPQGKFSVDLRGTGLRIADDLQWEDRGHRTSSKVSRKENNVLVEGKCGGYCGKCAPDRYKGLVFDVAPKNLPV